MILWRWWVNRCDRTMDARPLALIRISLCLCVVVDLVRIIQLELVPYVFQTYANGGLSRIQDPHLWVDTWLGTSTGPALLVVTLLCMTLGALGVGGRPILLLGILAYAQLGHLYPPGDRGVDRLIRSGLLILVFSGAHHRFSLSRKKALSIPAWPADFLKFLLVIVYLSAGFSKLIQQPGWLSLATESPLLRIVTDPLAGDLDVLFWSQWPWLFRLGSFGTIAFELSSPLILTRWCRYWAIAGVFMHLGIAASMTLGMFSWGVLSFYPLLLAPFILPWLDRWAAAKNAVEE